MSQVPYHNPGPGHTGGHGAVGGDRDSEKAGGEMERSSNEAYANDPDAGLSVEERAREEKRLIRMLDMKLIPWLSFLYLIS